MYDAQFKLKVIKFAKENNNSAVDRHFAVSEQLVRDWRKQKKYLFERTKRTKRYGVSPYIKLEKALNGCILEYCHNGYIVTRMMIQIQAIKFTWFKGEMRKLWNNWMTEGDKPLTAAGTLKRPSIPLVIG